MEDLYNSLKEGIIEAFIGIIQGLKSSEKGMDFAHHHGFHRLMPWTDSQPYWALCPADVYDGRADCWNPEPA